jgi:hypothetical protein
MGWMDEVAMIVVMIVVDDGMIFWRLAEVVRGCIYFIIHLGQEGMV